jgi:hypothetical protein
MHTTTCTLEACGVPFIAVVDFVVVDDPHHVMGERHRRMMCPSSVRHRNNSNNNNAGGGGSGGVAIGNSTYCLVICGAERSQNSIRFGLIICSVASFFKLQSTGLICLGSSCYSCCTAVRLLPISKRVSLLSYPQLVLISISPLGQSMSFNMYCSYL